MASSNKETSIANVLRDFLPVVDKLDMLKGKYGEHPFGKQYVALAGNMRAAFSQMGVSEYEAAVGEPLDPGRYLALEEVYSSGQPKGTVLESLKPGMELKGNVIRLAECIASLGEETEEQEEQEDVDEEEVPSEDGDESVEDEK